MDLERLKINRDQPTSPATDRAPAASHPGSRRAPRRSPWFGRLAFLAVIAVLVFVFQRKLTALVDRFRLPLVETAVVQLQSPLAASAVRGTAANGYVVASRRAALSADTPGRIVEMRVTEGSVVKQGDVVARLFAEEYEAALRRIQAELVALDAAEERAQAEVQAASAELERLEALAQEAVTRIDEVRATADFAAKQHVRAAALLEQGVDNEERLDSAVAEHDRTQASLALAGAAVASAKAAVEAGRANADTARARQAEVAAGRASLEAQRDQAQATLDKTEVRAPFDGIVVLKDAEVGEVVSPNSQGGSSARGSVVTMVDFDSLEVQVDVPEANLEKVRLDAPAQIFLDARPTYAYTGRVARIWPTANRQKSTIEVRVTFDERDDFLRPEMGARVVFDPQVPDRAPDDGTPDEGAAEGAAPSVPVLLVPSNALVRIDGQSGAFVLERDRVSFRPLQLGPERSGRQIVEAGLEPGERIVLDPPADLRDGGRVRTPQSS